MNYQEVKGDLLVMASEGKFDVICHGVNCFCKQKSGIAIQMVKMFHTDQFDLEETDNCGDINKLGQIDHKICLKTDGGNFFLTNVSYSRETFEDFLKMEGAPLGLVVVNAYTQFYNRQNNPAGREVMNLDYEALILCMRKMNTLFKGLRIGLPMIGSKKAGGDWNKIKQIVQNELKNCDITIVIYEEKSD